MTQARLGIMRATEVKAEKYAPEELGNARNLLLKSHQDVGEEKEDQARESAVKSKEESDKAIAKSLPLLSRDTYNTPKKHMMRRNFSSPSATPPLPLPPREAA